VHKVRGDKNRKGRVVIMIDNKLAAKRAKDSFIATSYLAKAIKAGFIPDPGEETMQLMAGYIPNRMTTRQVLEAFPGKQLKRVG
jgi:hypothetical protein